MIEAATEEMEAKKVLFAELDALCKPETIIATNTSSLSITEIAAATNRPDKIIGMHFFNPVPMMKLVEIIKGLATSEETKNTILELTSALGKTPVEVEEAPGFVVNRILIPMVNEAIGILADGVAKGGRYRRSNEARRQPSDGSLGSRRSDRAGCLSRYHGSPLQRIRRFQVQTASAAQENGTRRQTRKKDRRGIFRLQQVMLAY